MQTTKDLRKVVTSTSELKAGINVMIETVLAKMTGPSRASALGALGDAWMAVHKGDEASALAHVQKARAAVRRDLLAKGR